MVPFISADGFLQPCCQVGTNYRKERQWDDEWIPNPFIDPRHSLHNHSFSEIVESKHWNSMISKLRTARYDSCVYNCSKKDPSFNSATGATDKWSDKRILTKDMNTIQLETTNRCNLECPYCARMLFKTRKGNGLQVELGGKVDDPKWLNSYDIPVSILKDVFSYKHWFAVVDCGTHGDPIFYKYYHEMLEMMSGMMIDNYRASIAATGRPQKWWDQTHELWKGLNDAGIAVIPFWGVDGIETSHHHRIGQDWNEITIQMKIAAKNGIKGFWQYIPMSFNEHQIEDAKKLAEDWGVEFYLKPSERFKKNDPNRPTELYLQR